MRSHQRTLASGTGREFVKVYMISILLFALSSVSATQPKPVMESVYATNDVPLELNAHAAFWNAARPVYASVNANGDAVPGHETEVLSRWTKDNIYFLFICPYKRLYLNPAPNSWRETFGLWKWNVAEVFIGSDFHDIKRYKEFEVSPQNEWVDLDINLNKPHHEDGWLWNSGFAHATRVDQANHIWYAAMRIPFAALSAVVPAAGTEFRVNFFRTEGPPDDATEIMWQPTMSNTFHVPERFGLLKLVTK